MPPDGKTREPAQYPASPRAGRSHAVAALLFIGLAVLLTGPALLTPGRRVCAELAPDTWAHMWVCWRAKYAAAGLDAGIVQSHVVTYPGRIAELSAVFDPMLPLLSLPLQAAGLESTRVFTVLVALGLAFTGFAGYLLTSSLARSRAAGLVGGLVIAANPFLYRQAAGGFAEYAWWGLLPLALGLGLRAAREGGTRAAAAHAASVLALFLMSIYCAAWYVALAALWTAWQGLLALRGRPDVPLRRLLRLHAVTALCLLPLVVYWAVVLSTLSFRGVPLGSDFPVSALQRAQAERATLPAGAGPPPVETWVLGRTVASSLDLADLLSAGGRWARPRTRRAPAQPNRVAPLAITGDDGYERVFGGEWLLVLALASVAAGSRRWRAATPAWLLPAAGFLVLALGPFPVWKGVAHTDVLLPYAWAYKWVPGFSRFIIPGRAFLVTILCLAVLAARGADALARRTRSPGWVHAATGALLLAGFAWAGTGRLSLPVKEVHVPRLYEAIGREPGHFALLELPLGDDIDFRMFCQSVHNRPIYKGLVPNFMAVAEGTDAVDHDPLVRALDADAPPVLEPATVTASARALSRLGFRYLLLHAEGYPSRATHARVCAELTAALGPPRWSEGGVAAWRLDHREGEP